LAQRYAQPPLGNPDYKMKKIIFLIFALLLTCCKSTTTQETIDLKFQFENVSQEEITELKKKAEKGDIDSQTALGLMYLDGSVLEKDNKKAFSLFYKAGLKNHPIATNYLGLMYINGEGIQKNSIEAIKWFKKSSDSGNTAAASLLNDHFGQTIKWKISNKNFRGSLILEDKFGNWFPSKSAIDGVSENELLQINFKTNYEVSVILILENCLVDDNGLCSELYDFAIFKPDWSLEAEFLNKKPYSMSSICNNEKNILTTKLLTMKIKPEDDVGIYKVIVRIHQKKVLYEFLQIFNVSKDS